MTDFQLRGQYLQRKEGGQRLYRDFLYFDKMGEA